MGSYPHYPQGYPQRKPAEIVQNRAKRRHGGKNPAVLQKSKKVKLVYRTTN